MPSTTASEDHSSRSGITTAPNGQSVIPASTRPDGSLRKEIKVRPGYRPPEDVEVYKNRTADAWKNRGKAGVPGAQFVRAEPAAISHKSKSKKQKPSSSADAQPSPAATTELAAKPAEASQEQQIAQEPELGPEEEKEKQARKLSKKLRQARDLALKKENGESLLPEQFEKVIRINELIRQLDNLGFDADGQKKT